jgi:DNA-binding transcriptional regulator GbsR (MarR family)
LSEIIEFDDEIEVIEKDIFKFLMSYSLFIGQKTTFTTIKIYFITRKFLTQEKLQELTGFSRGTISQEIKKLISMNLIEKISVSNTGEITYSMKNPIIAFIHSFSNLTNDISKFANNINGIKEDIEEEKVLIENLHGFDRLYQLVNALANAVPFSLELIKMIDKELTTYQNE